MNLNIYTYMCIYVYIYLKLPLKCLSKPLVCLCFYDVNQICHFKFKKHECKTAVHCLTWIV